MVRTAPPPPTTAVQLQTSAAASAAVTTTMAPASSASAEDEAFKKNTDCVYFLASPLTCKKGSECDYRHSDVARVNPRDCWYWMHGNCLNPKCAFRHPPLDGLLGTQVPNAIGASVPPSQPATTPASQPPYASGKQAVPCIFFQKGLCLKGDWCQFSHALNSVNNRVQQGLTSTTATESHDFKQTAVGVEKSMPEKKIPQTNTPKSIQLPQTKPFAKLESTLLRNEVSDKKSIPPVSAINDDLHTYRPAHIFPVGNENQVNWTSRLQQPVTLNDHNSMSGKDTEDFSREPSPGFDVLVDDDLRDSDYYNSEEQFGRAREREGRNEFYDGRSGDYSSMVDADRDMYHESRGYDSYERQGNYDREQRRSSERIAYPERRRFSKGGSPDPVGESDLRHRLSKHRKPNGLRSVINQDYARERRSYDQGFHNSQRDSRDDRDKQENALSSRLRGRIKLPSRPFSSGDGSGLSQHREIERKRDDNGLSQGRSELPSRLRDRIKGNVEEDVNNGGRNNRGLRTRGDTTSDNNTDFAGPKSLAELRGRKNGESNEHPVNDRQSLVKRKYSKLESQQLTGDNLSFDGPKPLQEILKRKRRSCMALSKSGTSSGVNDDTSSKKKEVSSSKTRDGEEAGMSRSSPSKHDGDLHISASNFASVVKSTEGTDLSYNGQSSHSHNVNEIDLEEGMIINDDAEYQEPETYDDGDEEFDYEQVDGEDYNLDEGDNVDPEREYHPDDDDDDDGDDFAKKMGLLC